MRQFRTHYDNLSVTRTAPSEVIKAAYRTLAAKHHPDRNPGSTKATDTMGLLNESFAILSDDNKRAEHDRWIDRQEKLEAEQLEAALKQARASAPAAPAPKPAPPPEPPKPTAPPPPPPRKKISPVIWLGLVAAVVIAAAAGFFLMPGKPAAKAKPVATAATPPPEAAKARVLAGKIEIMTDPLGARATVDDRTATTPTVFENLAPGMHKVTLRADGYADWTSDARVVADQVLNFNVTLEKYAADSTLVVFTNPAGVAVEISGPSQASGISPMKFEELRAGHYEVILKKDGFPVEKRAIDLKEGETKSFAVSLLPGSVMITSTPSGAEVVLNGRSMGRTPLALNNATPGPQNVELRLEGFRPAYIEGTLPSGQSLTLHGQLDPRESPSRGDSWIIPLVDLEMVPVKRGVFSIGDAQGLADEKPVTRVTLTKDFWLGKFLVTQRQWKLLMGGNPSEFHDDDLPVENVSWTDAQEFCRKLNRQEGSAHHLPTGYIYSLPSEAQWEYAARAGDTGSGLGRLAAQAWYGDDGYAGTHAVGKKKPNAWGFYDLPGNVWEWCLDFKQPYGPGPAMDPVVKNGKDQVIRGGSWKSGAPECRYAYRGQAARETKRNDIGFRVALIPDPAIRW